MKNISNLAVAISGIVSVACLAPMAHANEITGSIGFGSASVNIVGSDLADATSFTVNGPFVSSRSGDYSSVPLATAVSFNGFEFSPPVSSVSPLWSFSIGTTNYCFDATSVSSHFNPDTDQWDIGGKGTAMVTGYTATPGTWNVDLSQSGATIVFDSSAGATPGVPDGGASALLLGGSFVGLAAYGRKWKL